MHCQRCGCRRAAPRGLQPAHSARTAADRWHVGQAADFEYNLQHGGWQQRNGVPPEIWDSIPPHQHNLPEKDGMGQTIWNAISYGKRLNHAFKRLLVDGARLGAGAPPYDDRWGRSRPQELPDEVCLHHRKLNCKDATNYKDHTTDSLVLADDGINTEVPIGGGYGGGNQFLWHQDFWYWGVGNGTLPSNEGSPNVSPWPDLATCFIAFTPCNRFNGGLEILRGSHRLRQSGRNAHNDVETGSIEFVRAAAAPFPLCQSSQGSGCLRRRSSRGGRRCRHPPACSSRSTRAASPPTPTWRRATQSSVNCHGRESLGCDYRGDSDRDRCCEQSTARRCINRARTRTRPRTECRLAGPSSSPTIRCTTPRLGSRTPSSELSMESAESTEDPRYGTTI